MKPTGNTVLITGGGTGIGLAVAKLLADKGNHVIVCGRRQEKLDEAKQATPELETHQCDVSEAEAREHLFETIRSNGHSVNVLINNAAIMRHYDLEDPESLDLDTIKRDIETNLLSVIALSTMFLPSLREQDGATIVNVSSPGGVVPVTGVPIYCATKAALHSYTMSLRYSLGDSVKVIEVYPPSVDTEMMSSVKLPTITCEDFAKRLLPRLEKGQEEIWVGEANVLKVLARLSVKRTLPFINRAVG